MPRSARFIGLSFQASRASRYFAALRKEIRQATQLGYRFNELYVGGGTPTVLPEELVKTIRSVRTEHDLDGISIETNPDDLRDSVVASLADAGVTRLSVGVQSFDDELLRQMGRLDTYGDGETIAARLAAAKGRIETLNIDMMFNFPRQSESSLRRDLDILTDRLEADQVRSIR